MSDPKIFPHGEPPAAAQPADALKAVCLDCGLDYGDFGMDTLLPRWQWLMIHPSEGGLLCANCIVKRAAKIPGAVGLQAVIGIAPVALIEPEPDLLCTACRTVVKSVDWQGACPTCGNGTMREQVAPAAALSPTLELEPTFSVIGFCSHQSNRHGELRKAERFDHVGGIEGEI